MTYKLNPFTGKLDTSDGPQGPAGVVSAAGPGSQGTPSISFAADLDTGLYNYTANGIAVSTNGTGRLFIDASGNVGVGTSLTTAYFTNYTPLKLSGSAGGSLGIERAGELRLLLTADNSFSYVSSFGNGGIVFSAQAGAFSGSTGIENMRLDSSGRLGLGTSNPGSYNAAANNLVISESGDAGITIASPGSQGSIFFADGTASGAEQAAGYIYYQHSSDTLVLGTSNQQRLTITSTGAVGIGTTSPNRLLEVSGSGTTTRLTSSTNTSTLEFSTPGGFAYIGSKDGPNVYVETNGSERARIDSSGRLGLGTSSPEAELHLNDATGVSRIRFTGGAVGADNFEIGQSITGVSNSGFSVYDVDAAATRFVIDSSGNVGIGTISPSFDLTIDKDSNSVVTSYTRSYNTGSSAGGRVSAASAVGTIAISAYSAAHSIWPSSTVLNSDSGFTGGLNIYQTGANPIVLWTNDFERARIDSSGRLLVGTSTSVTGATLETNSSSVVVRYTNPGEFGFWRANGSVGSPTAVADGNILGRLYAVGYNGTTYINAARIEVEVDGTPGANDMPGRIVFSTTADGSSTPTERMRITADGNISFGSTGYNLGFSNTILINPSDGLIGFGMDGREEYMTGAAGCYIYSGSGSSGTTLAGELILQSRSNSDRSITFVTGSTPAKRMEIAGNGNVTVVGALSKGSGSFKIDHPLPEKKETHHLVHSFIEGPQADLIYRGHVQLVNGVAAVNLDEAARMTEGTFEALCTNVCCFTSNESDWTAVRGSVSGNILRIEAQDPASNADVCWMVIGERKDQHMLDTNWTDENGRVITEPLKQQPVAEAD